MDKMYYCNYCDITLKAKGSHEKSQKHLRAIAQQLPRNSEGVREDPTPIVKSLIEDIIDQIVRDNSKQIPAQDDETMSEPSGGCKHDSYTISHTCNECGEELHHKMIVCDTDFVENKTRVLSARDIETISFDSVKNDLIDIKQIGKQYIGITGNNQYILDDIRVKQFDKIRQQFGKDISYTTISHREYKPTRYFQNREMIAEHYPGHTSNGNLTKKIVVDNDISFQLIPQEYRYIYYDIETYCEYQYDQIP